MQGLLHYPKIALAHPRTSWPARNTPRRLCSGSLRRYSGWLRRTPESVLDKQAVLCRPVEFYKLKMSTFRDGCGRGSGFCLLGPEMAPLRIPCTLTRSLLEFTNKSQLLPRFPPISESSFNFQSCSVPHALPGNQGLYASL
jgi:hypothetical protein